MSEARRPRRMAETIRKHVAEALQRELFDPGLQSVMVTKVELGPDLAVARIYLRSMIGGGDERRQRQVERAATRAAPLLRKGLNAKLSVRKPPEFSFHYDRGQDALDRVEEILDEIRQEGRTPPEG